MKNRFQSTSIDGVKRDAKSGVFYFRDTVHISAGESVFIDKSLKTTSISRAKELANELRTKLIRGDAKKEDLVSGHTFEQAFDLLLKIQLPKAPETFNQTKHILKHLKPWFIEHYPYLDTFEKDHEEIWSEYTAAQAAKSRKKNEDREFDGLPLLSPRKLKHDRMYLVMALKRAFTKGWTKKLFTKKDFPLNEAREPVGQYIEDADVNRLLAALEKSPKTRLQVLMAVTMGMRISEILHLRVAEVNLKAREIDLDPKRLKTRRVRKVAVPISNAVFPELRRLCLEAPGPFVFPASSNGPQKPIINPNQPQDDNRYHWSRARKETGLKVRFHDLRHTCLTNALASGMPPLTASKIFGATIQVIDRVYDHLKTEKKEQFRGMFDGRFK